MLEHDLNGILMGRCTGAAHRLGFGLSADPGIADRTLFDGVSAIVVNIEHEAVLVVARILLGLDKLDRSAPIFDQLR